MKKTQHIIVLASATFLFSAAVVLAANAVPGQVTDPASKVRACQAKEEVIKTRSENLVKLADGMQSTFGKIAQRVENYYTNTVVPSGKTVSNYDALTADVTAKQAAVQTALAKAQNDFKDFSCTAGNVRETMTKFKGDMQLVKKALKDYRTSIKNLIVAIHSVTGTTEKQAACQSACQRACGQDASCLTECYANCRAKVQE